MNPFQVVRCANTDQGTVQATDTGSDLNYYQLKTAVKHVLRFLARLNHSMCLFDWYLQEWVRPEPHSASSSSDWSDWRASRRLQWPEPGGVSSAETNRGEDEEDIWLHQNLSRRPFLSRHSSLPRSIDSHLYHEEVLLYWLSMHWQLTQIWQLNDLSKLKWNQCAFRRH